MKKVIWYSIVIYIFASLMLSPNSNSADIVKSAENEYWKWEKQYIMGAKSENWLLKSETTTHFIFIKQERSDNAPSNIMDKVAKVESNDNISPLYHFTNSEIIINLNGFKADILIISDILGRIHYSKSLEANDKQFSINVSNYPIGGYFALFVGKNKSKYDFKFIIH